MVTSVIWRVCLVAVLAYVGKYLADVGVFRHIETKGLEKCRLLVPSDGEGQAFEDFAIDYEKGVAYLPGDDRTWWHNWSIPVANRKKRGTVFRFDIRSETFTNLDLVDYPYEHFHPLGIGLLKRRNSQLFMTNHRVVNEQVIGAVDIFQIDSANENRLRWIDSVVHPLFTVPDDVLVIDDKTFYVSNIYHYRVDKSKLLHTIEVFGRLPWSNFLLCSKTSEWQCKVIDTIATANGIAASLDFKTVYLASTVRKRILVYERNPENNSLTYMRSLHVPFALDNLLIDEKDQLVVAGHPKPLEFIRHEKDRRKYRSSSEVVIFPDPKSNSTFESLLLTKGEVLSASTVGGTFENKLLVGALCDPGILVCEDLLDHTSSV